MPDTRPRMDQDGNVPDRYVSQFGTGEPDPEAWAEPQRFAIPLDLGQWDRIIDALQFKADDDPLALEGGQEASDLAVLLRSEVDRLVPGTYGGCEEVSPA